MQRSGKFACLASHPSLALRNGGTVEVVKAKCQNLSSKLCSLFGQCEHKASSFFSHGLSVVGNVGNAVGSQHFRR